MCVVYYVVHIKWMAHHNAIYLVMRDDELELDDCNKCCVLCCVNLKLQYVQLRG